MTFVTDFDKKILIFCLYGVFYSEFDASIVFLGKNYINTVSFIAIHWYLQDLWYFNMQKLCICMMYYLFVFMLHFAFMMVLIKKIWLKIHLGCILWVFSPYLLNLLFLRNINFFKCVALITCSISHHTNFKIL